MDGGRVTILLSKTPGSWFTSVIQSDRDPNMKLNFGSGKRQTVYPYFQVIGPDARRKHRSWPRTSVKGTDFSVLDPVPFYWADPAPSRGTLTQDTGTDFIPTASSQRVAEVLSAIGAHLDSWQALHGVTLVSLTNSNGNIVAVFSGQLPPAEKKAIGLIL
jgi:hypothetical protein